MRRLLIFIRNSYWFIPSFYGFIALFLAIVSSVIDIYLFNNPETYHWFPSWMLSDIDLAHTLLGSISGSILTMTTISFSSILVVLTTYLSEFSPRTLQNFMNDSSTQRILGVFISGFLYSTTLLLLTKKPINEDDILFFSPTLALIVAIISVGFFVFFVHHVSRWIQVRHLIEQIDRKTKESVKNQLPKRSKGSNPPWQDWEASDLHTHSPHGLISEKSGYIQWVDTEKVLKQAEEDDVIVEMKPRVGQYIEKGKTMMVIWTSSESSGFSDYRKWVLIGEERESVQDITFGIHKIVEIALRSLSPGINDPFTAIYCIEKLGHLLAMIGNRDLYHTYRHDEHEQLRFMVEPISFSDLLYEAFYQIRHYGQSDPAVAAALYDALYEIAVQNDSFIKEEVADLYYYLVDGIEAIDFLKMDETFLQKKQDKLASILFSNQSNA